MIDTEKLAQTSFMRGLEAWRRFDIANLIANKDWEALFEICHLRDAFVAEKHAIYAVSYAEAQRLLDWMRRSGWFCLDADRISAKIDNSKNISETAAKIDRPRQFGPIVKFTQKIEKSDKTNEFV